MARRTKLPIPCAACGAIIPAGSHPPGRVEVAITVRPTRARAAVSALICATCCDRASGGAASVNDLLARAARGLIGYR